MADQRTFDIVGVGALNLDYVHTVSRVTLDGLERVLASMVEAGGCSANATYALARLGLRCGYVGAMANDEEGELILNSFRSAGVDTRGITRRTDLHTGKVLILSDAEGRRAMYLEPGASGLSAAEQMPGGYLSGVRLLLLSSFNGEIAAEVQRALLAALPQGATLALILDGHLAQEGTGTLAPLLARCDVLFANRQEIAALSAGEGPARLLRAGCGTVVMTLGAGEYDAACRIFSTQGEWSVPARRTFPGAVSDATGAGDAFAAGYLCGRLAGWTPERCGELGHTLAGFILTTPGCRSGLPNRQELLERHRRFFGDPATEL